MPTEAEFAESKRAVCKNTTSGKHMWESVAYDEFKGSYRVFLPPCWINKCKACNLMDDADEGFQKQLQEKRAFAEKLAELPLKNGGVL